MSKTVWYAHAVSPIDWSWQHLKTVAETLSEMANESEYPVNHDLYTAELAAFIEGWNSAKKAAAKVGWEGDFRGVPRVFWLPVENSFEFGFVFKQDNNGETFVLSPQPFLHLDPLVAAVVSGPA